MDQPQAPPAASSAAELLPATSHDSGETAAEADTTLVDDDAPRGAGGPLTSSPVRRRKTLSNPSPMSESTAVMEEKPFRPTLFDLAHTRRSSANWHETVQKQHAHPQGSGHPISWRHLFKPPVVRQWLAGGLLAREGAEREAARFELFFDLAFVGIIHQLAEQASDNPSNWSVYIFVVFFYLSWSVWQDVRSFINTSGTDDVPQRAYVLIVMCILLGLSSNASALEIECPTEGADGAGEAATAEASAGEEAAHFMSFLFRRAMSEVVGEATMLPGGCELQEGWDKAIRGAVAFFLVAKAIRIGMCLFYGWYLPRFRSAHYWRGVSVAAACAFYIPLLTQDRLITFLILPIVAISLELSAPYAVAISTALTRGIADRFRTYRAGVDPEVAAQRKARHFAHSFTPAINIEHAVERLALFIVLVLGEMIINSTFRATDNQSGIHTEYLRCVFSLCIAYAINWLYVDNDLSRTFMHALRWNWFTSITWSHLHFPLAASLIFASAATTKMVGEEDPSDRYRWFFAAGQAITMVTLGFFGLLHKPLDADGAGLIPRPFRVFGRFAAGVLFACLPLAKTLSSTAVLGIHAGTLFFLIVSETIGKIGLVASEEKIEAALTFPVEDDKEDMRVELETLGVHPTEEMEHELLDHERGEDDVGVEEDLGQLKVTRIGREQRLAYAF
ncbi:hypothetical protein MNV49_004021 [Pseudohyphozyma bogoriensis]|nr:hypothetical protein MNV49_004021 [Pseudohyphozyma bogoriensis]